MVEFLQFLPCIDSSYSSLLQLFNHGNGIIFPPEIANSTAFSLQYICTHRCISQNILGTRRKVSRLGAMQMLSSSRHGQSRSFHFLGVWTQILVYHLSLWICTVI